jgi:hypothetical protein
MHRRPIGRGRTLAVISAVVMLVACLLPWYTVGGGGDLPAIALGAFSGSGILIFLAALVTIALVALPYAAGDRPIGADRWLFYLLFAVAAWLGLLYWPIDKLGDLAGGLLPGRAPGFWVAIVGTIGLSRAVYDIAREQDGR